MTPPLVVVAGPTASGKTQLAIELAEALNAEIVGADSQQIYKHFVIGTAQPSASERARVPHHVVAALEPTDACSAARYQVLADQAIDRIRAKGRRVVVCGGTGLYLRVLLRGVVEAPSADPALRAELEALADRDGNQALHDRLRAVDPASAQRLPVGDRVRMIRAIEIHALSGRTASELREAHAFAEARHPHRLFVLSPPREALYAAINARAKAMYDAGLVEETRLLVERGYHDAPPMRSVGYAQALQVLEGRLTRAQAEHETATESRHYAKRQLTWFKKEPGATVLEPPYDAAALAKQLRAEV